VLRNRRPADRKLTGELDDGHCPRGSEAHDDGAPGGVAEGMELRVVWRHYR
jgi:hypothetical protein